MVCAVPLSLSQSSLALSSRLRKATKGKPKQTRFLRWVSCACFASHSSARDASCARAFKNFLSPSAEGVFRSIRPQDDRFVLTWTEISFFTRCIQSAGSNWIPSDYQRRQVITRVGRVKEQHIVGMCVRPLRLWIRAVFFYSNDFWKLFALRAWWTIPGLEATEGFENRNFRDLKWEIKQEPTRLSSVTHWMCHFTQMSNILLSFYAIVS